MRNFYLVLLAVSVAMLTGCAVLGEFMGGVIGSELESGSIAGAAGGLAGGYLKTAFPWVITAISSIVGITEDVKRRKWKKVTEVGVRTVNRILHEKPDYKDIPKILADEQDKEGIRPIVRKVKHKIDSGG